MNYMDEREHWKAARDCNRWHVVRHDDDDGRPALYLKNGERGALEHFGSEPDYADATPNWDNTAWAAATREAHRRNVIIQKRRQRRDQRGGM